MTQTPRALSRRSLFAGAGTAGALAAAAQLVPVATPLPPRGAAPRPAPSRGGGYHLSEHVLKYFKTTRV
ncbi:MAG: formate dehydrogenase [Pseudomonadota bacterium]